MGTNVIQPVTLQQARSIAMSMPDAVEQPHFEKTSFRVSKRIFMTLDAKNKRACLKLSPVDQDIFSTMDKSVIYPVPNSWGKQGWTWVELSKVKSVVFKAAVSAAFAEVVNSGSRKGKKM
jgi:hypothetical protein